MLSRYEPKMIVDAEGVAGLGESCALDVVYQCSRG